jgi:hypothetical protein
MDTRLKYKLIAVAVGVAAAAAGGVAISSAAHSSNALAGATGDSHGFGGARPGNGRFGPPGAGGPPGFGGKSAAGLIAAMVAAEKKRIEQAVTAGTLTRAQADRAESALEQRVTDRSNGSPMGTV